MTADYVSVDQKVRPIVAGLFDQLTVDSSLQTVALVGTLARIDDVSTAYMLERQWWLSGPAPDDEGTLPLQPVVSEFFPGSTVYLVSGFVVHVQTAGTLQIQLELAGQVVATRVIPVTMVAEEAMS